MEVDSLDYVGEKRRVPAVGKEGPEDAGLKRILEDTENDENCADGIWVVYDCYLLPMLTKVVCRVPYSIFPLFAATESNPLQKSDLITLFALYNFSCILMDLQFVRCRFQVAQFHIFQVVLQNLGWGTYLFMALAGSSAIWPVYVAAFGAGAGSPWSANMALVMEGKSVDEIEFRVPRYYLCNAIGAMFMWSMPFIFTSAGLQITLFVIFCMAVAQLVLIVCRYTFGTKEWMVNIPGKYHKGWWCYVDRKSEKLKRRASLVLAQEMAEAAASGDWSHYRPGEVRKKLDAGGKELQTWLASSMNLYMQRKIRAATKTDENEDASGFEFNLKSAVFVAICFFWMFTMEQFYIGFAILWKLAYDQGGQAIMIYNVSADVLILGGTYLMSKVPSGTCFKKFPLPLAFFLFLQGFTVSYNFCPALPVQFPWVGLIHVATRVGEAMTELLFNLFTPQIVKRMDQLVKLNAFIQMAKCSGMLFGGITGSVLISLDSGIPTTWQWFFSPLALGLCVFGLVLCFFKPEPGRGGTDIPSGGDSEEERLVSTDLQEKAKKKMAVPAGGEAHQRAEKISRHN